MTVSPLRSGAAVGALAAFTQYMRELQAKAWAAASGEAGTDPVGTASEFAPVEVSADAVTGPAPLNSWQGQGAGPGPSGSGAGSSWPQAYGVTTQAGVGGVIDLLS